jgi:hypothetical protein
LSLLGLLQMRGGSSAKMHHAGEGVVGERALANTLQPAAATLWSFSTDLPLTPIAPNNTPSWMIGRIRGKPRLWPYWPAVAMVEHASRAAHRALILMEVNSTPNPLNITDP